MSDDVLTVLVLVAAFLLGGSIIAAQYWLATRKGANLDQPVDVTTGSSSDSRDSTPCFRRAPVNPPEGK